jgi:di/tricarboxylate transporter
MFGASASFLTPVGYQTNLMVQGPGGYRFADFFRVGFLLSILVGLTVIVGVPLIWPF